MTKLVKKDGRKLYQCEECGFHYENKERVGGEMRSLVQRIQKL